MKLKKVYPPLVSALINNKLETPNEVQKQCFNTIKSGADLFAVAATGSGKTTTIVMSVIQLLKYAQEEIPRAIIITNSKENTEEFEMMFEMLGKQTNLRVISLYDQHKIYNQKDEIFEGSDIIVGSARRFLELYNVSGINLKLLKTFVVDNASEVLKNEIQSKLSVFASNLPKCQQIIFSTEKSNKLSNFVKSRLVNPYIVEISDQEEEEDKK